MFFLRELAGLSSPVGGGFVGGGGVVWGSGDFVLRDPRGILS